MLAGMDTHNQPRAELESFLAEWMEFSLSLFYHHWDPAILEHLDPLRAMERYAEEDLIQLPQQQQQQQQSPAEPAVHFVAPTPTSAATATSSAASAAAATGTNKLQSSSAAHQNTGPSAATAGSSAVEAAAPAQSAVPDYLNEVAARRLPQFPDMQPRYFTSSFIIHAMAFFHLRRQAVLRTAPAAGRDTVAGAASTPSSSATSTHSAAFSRTSMG